MPKISNARFALRSDGATDPIPEPYAAIVLADVDGTPVLVSPHDQGPGCALGIVFVRDPASGAQIDALMARWRVEWDPWDGGAASSTYYGVNAPVLAKLAEQVAAGVLPGPAPIPAPDPMRPTLLLVPPEPEPEPPEDRATPDPESGTPGDPFRLQGMFPT